MQNNRITNLPEDLQLFIWEIVHNSFTKEICKELRPSLMKLEQKWYWNKIDLALIKWRDGTYSDIDILNELRLDTLVDLWEMLRPPSWESPSSDAEIKYYLLDYPFTAISIDQSCEYD